MRAFRTHTTITERDEETGEPFNKDLPILVVQFNSLKQEGSHLMPNSQVADHMATIITQFGNQPDQLRRLAEILINTAIHSAGEREAING